MTNEKIKEILLEIQPCDIESSVSKWGLIIAIAAGVGLFVAFGIMRVILSIPLRLILIISYIAVFGLAGFAPQALQGVAFDSGGATTGPMTVPFILAHRPTYRR